jgi:hypothetical protein
MGTVFGTSAVIGAEAKKVEVRQSWDGTIPDDKLRKEEPANGFITDEKTWAKLWKAWCGNAKLPKVDFDKELILVQTVEGLNTISPPDLRLTDKGNLRVPLPVSTLLPASGGFGYKIVTVRRDGVKTVNGKTLKKG